MPDNNKDFELNNPARSATEKALQGETPSNFLVEDNLQVSGHRDGEIKITVPEQEISQKREMTEGEIKHYSQIDSDREEERIEALEKQVLQEWGSSYFPEWIRKTGMWILAAVASILLLLVVGEVTNFLVQLQALPTWAQWTIGSLLILVGGVVLYLTARLILLYFKLQKNEQINLTALKALKERDALQQMAQQETNEAVRKLKEYLEIFSDDSEKLMALGFTRKECTQLSKIRRDLIEKVKDVDSHRWLKQYRAGFQSILDEIAQRRVKDYAIKTGFKTAISPLPILDTSIVLALSLSMIRDLMTLYNLKMNRAGAGKVLMHAIAQVYLAGHFQDITSDLTDSITNSLADHLGQTTARVGKMIGSKAGEGIANGVLIYRLGKATIKLLQPAS